MRAVLITALIAGTLDMTGATISYMINGGNGPTAIFQYIASAIFGKAAYDGTVSMMIAGLFFHYVQTCFAVPPGAVPYNLISYRRWQAY